jgi:HK97 family phage prohead protease
MSERLDFALELKAVDAKQRIIEGYASAWSVDNGEDEFAPGAWSAWLGSTPLSEIQVPSETHNRRSQPLGMPMEIREDDRGLFTKTRIHKTTAGDDWLAIAAERQAAGIPLGMSVGYAAEKFGFQTKNGRSVRRITQAALLEYSFTPIPMNEDATVTAVKQQADETKAGRTYSAAEKAFLSGHVKALRDIADQMEARMNADAAPAEEPKTEVTQTKTEATAGPFDLAIALAKARGGLYA